MTNECAFLADTYRNWLSNEINAREIDVGCELTTPFLDRHNDHILVFAEREGERIHLSDDGFALRELRYSGFKPNTGKRRSMWDSLVRSFGLKEVEGELVAEATDRTLGQKTHDLVQAIVRSEGLHDSSPHRVRAMFAEDVRHYLSLNGVPGSPSVKLDGKSGYVHEVDYLVPSMGGKPERIVQAIQSPTKNIVSSALFVLNDIRARRENSDAIAILNDAEHLPADPVAALANYSVRHFKWSEREHLVNEIRIT